MKSTKLFLKLILSTFMFSISVFAQTDGLNFKNVSPYPIDEVIEVHRGPLKNIEIGMKILYPNGCYRQVQTKALVNRDLCQIELFNESQKMDGVCTQSFIANFPKAEIQGLENGNYQLIDSYDHSVLGELQVTDNEAAIKERI